MTPGVAAAEVDDDDGVGAFRAGVGDVGDALARGRQGRGEVEADVVEVLRLSVSFVCFGGSMERVRRTEVEGAASGEKTIVVIILLFFKSTPTSFGPPYDAGTIVPFGVAARPVSRIHKRSAGSTTTDCTPMR